MIEIRRPLGDVSPRIAKKWGGVSPDFDFVEHVCPGCGYLVDATQRRGRKPSQRKTIGYWILTKVRSVQMSKMKKELRHGIH